MSIENDNSVRFLFTFFTNSLQVIKSALPPSPAVRHFLIFILSIFSLQPV